MADVGRTFPAGTFTLESYLTVETAYIDSALRFIEEAGWPRLFARGVEASDGAAASASTEVVECPPREGEEIARADFARLCRSCLRELVWCRIESEDATCFIHFGYDYYMYIGSPVDCPEAIQYAQKAGLFVESFDSPYLDRA